MAPAGIGAEVEGVHAVAAALDAGRVRELHVEQGRLDRSEVGTITDRAHEAGITVHIVDDVRPLATTDAPQGVVARCEPIRPLKLRAAVGAMDLPALLVLDHVEDPRNVGAAARSAWAAGMSAIVVSERRSAPLGATAFKAAVGALEHIPVIPVASVPDALRTLSRLDLWTVGLDATGDRSLFGLDLLDQPVAMCIGAEGRGLSRLTAERCDVLVRIPMAPGTESLNASVASALACFEVARVRGSVS